mmetsp:Transcript_10786/g.14512  ORF Transcript_10786/g.14512 Transcript_10786/m.14512 type:complete len:166 (+) Transcript_10786:1348-1845(+)
MELSWDDDWHVGTSALIGYYASFDYTTRELSLSPLTGGSKQTLKTGSKPDIVLGNDLFTILLLSIANAFVLTVLVLLCLAVYFNTNVLADDDQNSETNAAEEASPELPDEAVEAEEIEDADDSSSNFQLLSKTAKKSRVSAAELEGLLNSALQKKNKTNLVVTLL